MSTTDYAIEAPRLKRRHNFRSVLAGVTQPWTAFVRRTPAVRQLRLNSGLAPFRVDPGLALSLKPNELFAELNT